MGTTTSDRLRKLASRIMVTWEARANEEVLSALKLESLALRDSLPELLIQLADALSTTIDRTSARVRADRKDSLRIGQKHGKDRADSETYTMDQMIFEYHILRQVVCDVLEEDVPLTTVEREVIVCVVEQAVNDAATQFSETLRLIQERLAATLTHDLRGPITAAKINAQLLMKRVEKVDPKTFDSANRIVSNMDRLDSMIRDLLDASLVRAGESLPINPEACDLGLMSQEVVDEFNVIYGDRFILVSDSGVDGFWSRSGVRRVIENLATNAEKYSTPKTPITITVKGKSSSITVSVRNEGNPIPEENQAKLFERFHRARASAKKTGWGLGLTVVKGVIESHGGTVEIVSGPAVGTTFTFELPRDARPVGR
jgi:signal transduction histidine kinase